MGPVVEFDGCEALRETDLAILVRFEDGREEWIPKSQIADDSEVFDADENRAGTLVVTEWIAEQKGLA
jgi:hypothetical protein